MIQGATDTTVQPLYYIYPGIAKRNWAPDHRDNLDVILAVVQTIYAEKYKDPMEKMHERSHTFLYANARMMFWYIANELMPEIGSSKLSRYPFPRHHTTVMNGWQQIQNQLDIKDPETIELYQQIKNQLL